MLLRLREMGCLRVVDRKPKMGDMIATDGEGETVVVEVTEIGLAFLREGLS